MSRRPLVLNLRPPGQAAELSRLLRAAGCEPLEVAAVEVVPAWSSARVADVLAALRRGRYGWLVVPSSNAAHFLVEALGEAGGGPADLRQVATISGPGTAEALAAAGLPTTRVLARFSARAALETLLQARPLGGAVLAPRAAEGRDELVEGLRAHGEAVDEVVFYHTRAVEPDALAGVAALLRGGDVAAVALTSPSSAQSLAGGLLALGHDPAALLRTARLVCLGESTAEAARLAGLPVAQVAERTSLQSLAEAVAAAVAEPAHGPVPGAGATLERAL